MKVHTETIELISKGHQVSYHEISGDIKDIIENSGIKNGIAVVQSPHTTCSVIFEEFVHDLDFRGIEFLQVDLNNVLENIIPKQMSENYNYRYPGPEHHEFLLGMNDENFPPDPAYILNADAHLRASFLGASETFTIEDGVLNIGAVGSIYFIDFDQNRSRKRQCKVTIMGV